MHTHQLEALVGQGLDELGNGHVIDQTNGIFEQVVEDTHTQETRLF